MKPESSMWENYELSIQVDRLVGGLPKHPDIVKRWQEAKWPTNETVLQPGDPQSVEQATANTIEALGNQAVDPDDKIAGIWTGFAERDGKLVLESRQVKAMLKESANIVRGLLYKNEAKAPALRARVAERVFVKPHWIDLGVSEPTGIVERPIHVMTARGPRTALKKTDYIDDCKFTVKLLVLNDGIVTEKILRAILDHASLNGIGTDRSQGNGTFSYELRRQ